MVYCFKTAPVLAFPLFLCLISLHPFQYRCPNVQNIRLIFFHLCISLGFHGTCFFAPLSFLRYPPYLSLPLQKHSSSLCFAAHWINLSRSLGIIVPCILISLMNLMLSSYPNSSGPETLTLESPRPETFCKSLSLSLLFKAITITPSKPASRFFLIL